jgi:hypothetical protein
MLGRYPDAMTQQARQVSEFGPWIDHFEQNATVHAHVDAAIEFDGNCAVSAAARHPLITSVRRFQRGESGDGLQLLRKAADPESLRAAELFVAEEQQHAALLLRLLGYLGGKSMRRHWSDAVFVRVRRLMGLRTELMVLTVAEVIALSYYGGLAADDPDPWCVRWPRGSSPPNIRTSGFSSSGCAPASLIRAHRCGYWRSACGG